jgi:hypothetical protein
MLVGDELGGDGGRVHAVATIVPDKEAQRNAIDPSGLVDLVDGELDAALILRPSV